MCIEEFNVDLIPQMRMVQPRLYAKLLEKNTIYSSYLILSHLFVSSDTHRQVERFNIKFTSLRGFSVVNADKDGKYTMPDQPEHHTHTIDDLRAKLLKHALGPYKKKTPDGKMESKEFQVAENEQSEGEPPVPGRIYFLSLIHI